MQTVRRSNAITTVTSAQLVYFLLYVGIYELSLVKSVYF